jgi:HD-GYP domain-containing protein (c-di-GMP phosphodiesterase class II)
MAIALATKLSMPVSKVKSIAMGALMHDLGKAFLPAEILNKTEPLTESETEQMKKHPLLGYNMVKDNNETSPITKISILMHHETLNGSGYPMGLSGDKIHYSARIITICNEFDTALNDKQNKNILHTTDAIEYLVGASGFYFDKAMVDEFIKIIPVYSEGSIVLLSNGILAIVVKNNPVSLTRPIVRMFYDPKTKIKYSSLEIIDLKDELSIKIAREIKTNVKDIMK